MIAIYEPIYLPGQVLTEPAFRPLQLEDNSHADWREFRIIVDMYRRGLHREQKFTGLFSPKFRLKTGLTGQRFIDFIQDNADADVCFVNPFPQIAYISYNVWMQGELAHPGLVSRSQRLLDASGIDLQIVDVPRHGPDVLGYCNYWVGNENFWDSYVGGLLLPIATFLESQPTSEIGRDVLDTTHHTNKSSFLPFIIERLFSSYLTSQNERLCKRAFDMDPIKSCLNQFERDIVSFRREIVDAADLLDNFPGDLKDNMQFICNLWQQFTFAYYRNQAHPHSGAPMNSD